MEEHSADDTLHLNSSPLSPRRTSYHCPLLRLRRPRRIERQPATRAVAGRASDCTVSNIARALAHPWQSAQCFEPPQCAVKRHDTCRTGEGEAESGCRAQALAVRSPQADLDCPWRAAFAQSEFARLCEYKSHEHA